MLSDRLQAITRSNNLSQDLPMYEEEAKLALRRFAQILSLSRLNACVEMPPN